MTETVKHGMVKPGNVVSSALSKMQIARLSKESGLEHAFHTTVESAGAWLLHGTVPN